VHPTPTLTGVVRGVQLEQCITKLGETRTKWDVLCLDHQHDQTGEELDLDGVKLQKLSSPVAEVHAYVMPRKTLQRLLSFNLHTNMVSFSDLLNSLAGLAVGRRGRCGAKPIEAFLAFHEPLVLLGPHTEGQEMCSHQGQPEGLRCLLQAIVAR